LLCSGGSQASAMIAQICSGVNVAGVPGRAASANFAATEVSTELDSQQARQ